MRTIKFCYVVFCVTSRLSVINTSSSVCREQQTTPLIAHQLATVWRSWRVYNTCGHTVDNTRWSQILVENRDFCLPHLHLTPLLGGSSPVGILPLALVWKNYNGVASRRWKKFENVFTVGLVVSKEYTNVTDRQTDTARRHRPRLCIASRGNKTAYVTTNVK